MFILFVFCIFQGMSQTLMMDSRDSTNKPLNLKLFNQQFSIWFTYHKTTNQEYINLIEITNHGYLIVKIQAQPFCLRVTYNKNQIAEIENQSLLNNRWIHLIFNQNENFQGGVFYIKTPQNQMAQYQFKADSTQILDNKSLIITDFNLFSFCIIYDQQTFEIDPIITSANMQLLINQLSIPLLIYHSDSALEIFMKKKTNKKYNRGLIIISTEQFSQMSIHEFENYFIIFVNEIISFKDSNSRLLSWFRIFIKFNNIKLEYQVQFVDLKIEKSFDIMYLPDIFYTVSLSVDQSNYQFLKFTTFFNVKNNDLFDKKQLLEFKNCDSNIRYYFDIESNSCRDYIDQNQIENIDYDRKFDVGQVQNKESFQQQQIGEVISRQIFLNITNQNNYPFLESYNNETYNFIKEPFLLWKYQQQVFCSEQYFGQYCNKFIKKCLYAQYDYCENCQYGYLLISNKCVKCPQNCLFCILQQLQYKCLISQIGYFVTKKYKARLCQCLYCNTDGECVAQESAINSIQSCLSDLKCFLKKCQIHEHFRLTTQNCFILPNNHQAQLLYYSFYSNQTNQHSLQDLQFLLLQNFQLYGNSLFNQMISNYYLNSEIQHFKQSFSNNYFQFEMDEYYYQSFYNLECAKKGFNKVGIVTCKEYKYMQNNKCLKEPCQYRLTIKDIFYYTGVQTYLEYKNDYYSSIIELLQSVKFIGIQFYSVHLKINFICQNFNEISQCHEKINLTDTTLIPNFKNTIIAIQLNFQSTKSSGYQFINLSITADQIVLEHQILNFGLYLALKVNTIMISNLIINDRIVFKFVDGILCRMMQIDVIKNLTISLNNFSHIQLRDFQSNNLSYFRLESQLVERLTIHNFEYSIQEQFHDVFDFFNVAWINLSYLRFQFIKNYGLTLIHIYLSKDLTIKNISILGQVLENSKLFLIEYITTTNISNYFCQIDNISNSVVLQTDVLYLQIQVLQQLSKFTIYKSTLLYLKSSYILLHNISINLSQFDSFPLIITNGSGLSINNFQFDQQSNTTLGHVYSNGYLIQFQYQQTIISGLRLNGIQLNDFGLLLLETNFKTQIKQLTLTNIKCYFQSERQIVFIKGFSLSITQSLLRNIWIESVFQTILIDVQNDNTVEMQYIQISQIQQLIYLNQSYIFQLTNVNSKLNMINVTQCKNIELLFSKSEYLYITQLEYFDNSYQSILKISEIQTRLVEVYYSKISLKKNQTVLFSPTSRLVHITFRNIQFNLEQVNNYIYLRGYELTVSLTNICITYEIQLDTNNTYDEFFIVKSYSVYVQNLVVKNLFQPLFLLSRIQTILIQDVFLLNTEIRHKSFIFYVFNSHLDLDNVKIISIKQCQGIFQIVSAIQREVIIHNFLLKDATDVNMIFNIHQNESQFMLFKNILISNTLNGDIFQFKVKEPQNVQIENLFVNTADNFLVLDSDSHIFVIKNSIIRVQNFHFNHSNNLLKLISSEIIINYQFNLPQIQLDLYSKIFNNEKLSIIKDQKLIVTLSLNRINQLRSIRLEDSNQKECKKFLISQNGSFDYYFYVPSGQKLTEYKILNLSSLQHIQVYFGFYLVVQGFKYSQYSELLNCTQQQYYNDQLVNQQYFSTFAIQKEFFDLNDQVFTLSPLNSNYTVFQLTCYSTIDALRIQLQYNVKAFPCQLGEFLYQNQCLECKIKYNQYSVKQNSNKCNYIDQNKIKSVKKGLVELNKGYWRYTFTSSIIEYCDQNYCNGGWIPGDKSCKKSRIGALCKECDIYNIRGDGSYANSNQQCIECERINVQLMFKILFIILWQFLLIINRYYSNQKLSEQYLMFRVGFRQFYLILYRQSIDLPSIITKMFANYMFMLYIFRNNFNITGFSFINNINIINNPGLITKAQMDCILSQAFQINIIYSALIFQIVQVFFVISLSYTIYLIILKFKKTRFHLGLILYATEGIIVYNLNVILVISFNLLSYQVVSGVKWIKYNMQYLFYTDKHVGMIQFILPLTLLFLIFPFLFPLAIKYLSVFNRQVKRIYALYYQEYKPQLIFWEYLILYIKYAIMIFYILDDQQMYCGTLIIWLMCLLSQNLKPYYLKNLNIFEQNLFVFYGIQLTLLNMSNFKDQFIITLNLLIFTYFVQKVQFSLNSYNLKNTIQLKLKIVSKFNWIRNFSGLAKNQRQLKNKLSLIYLVKTQILKKQFASTTANQVILNTEQEIEMPMIFKQIQPKIAQSRNENPI